VADRSAIGEEMEKEEEEVEEKEMAETWRLRPLSPSLYISFSLLFSSLMLFLLLLLLAMAKLPGREGETAARSASSFSSGWNESCPVLSSSSCEWLLLVVLLLWLLLCCEGEGDVACS
jgi:hypothetical protein